LHSFAPLARSISFPPFFTFSHSLRLSFFPSFFRYLSTISSSTSTPYLPPHFPPSTLPSSLPPQNPSQPNSSRASSPPNQFTPPSPSCGLSDPKVLDRGGTCWLKLGMWRSVEVVRLEDWKGLGKEDGRVASVEIEFDFSSLFCSFFPLILILILFILSLLFRSPIPTPSPPHSTDPLSSTPPLTRLLACFFFDRLAVSGTSRRL